MFLAEFYLFKKIMDKKKYFRDAVAEIYLHKDGETLEVIYHDQLWVIFNIIRSLLLVLNSIPPFSSVFIAV